MQASSKPLPPFGAILQQYQLSRVKLGYAPYIYVGAHSWREANKMIPMQVCLCLPMGDPIEMYQWPVKGLSLILFNTGEIETQELNLIAHHLLKNGAKQVCIFSNNTVQEIYHSI